MRPPEELRAAIVGAIKEAGPLSLRDAAQRSKVAYDVARYTVQNACRSGAISIVGHEKREHCPKWVALYDVPREEERSPDPFVDLGAAISQWR